MGAFDLSRRALSQRRLGGILRRTSSRDFLPASGDSAAGRRYRRQARLISISNRKYKGKSDLGTHGRQTVHRRVCTAVLNPGLPGMALRG